MCACLLLLHFIIVAYCFSLEHRFSWNIKIYNTSPARWATGIRVGIAEVHYTQDIPRLRYFYYRVVRLIFNRSGTRFQTSRFSIRPVPTTSWSAVSPSRKSNIITIKKVKKNNNSNKEKQYIIYTNLMNYSSNSNYYITY